MGLLQARSLEHAFSLPVPVMSAEPTATSDYRPAEGVGSVLAGKYKLVEEIGERGMGSVFMAQQTELRGVGAPLLDAYVAARSVRRAAAARRGQVGRREGRAQSRCHGAGA